MCWCQIWYTVKSEYDNVTLKFFTVKLAEIAALASKDLTTAKKVTSSEA